MSLNHPIDLYCERTDPGFWSEPTNALTNLSFIIAALWAWQLATRKKVNDIATHILIAVTALIGIGSFLFHTFGNTWSLMADVIPIGIFALVYVTVALRRFFGFSLTNSLISMFGFFIATSFLLSTLSDFAHSPVLNSSLQYFPMLFAMVMVATILAHKNIIIWKTFAMASAVFSLSLFFRTTDLFTCNSLPLGTHFLWHLLNGLTLALLLRAMIDWQHDQEVSS